MGIKNKKKFEPSLDMVFKLDAEELQGYMFKSLIMMGKKPVPARHFVYAPGTVPVLLVAHMDTVHSESPTICKSSDGNIMMAPQGIGGDDRCGVWIVLQVLKKYDCHVLFTQDEEIGGLGALAFTKSGIMPAVNFIVEPDRKGDTDAVYYDCGNDDFMDFVKLKTGYKESWGSFSDISYIAPYLDRAAVNLSSGYHEPHTNAEYVVMDQVNDTIQAIENMLEDLDTGIVYTYQEAYYNTAYAYTGYDRYNYGSKYGKWVDGKWVANTTTNITKFTPAEPSASDKFTSTNNPTGHYSDAYEDEWDDHYDKKYFSTHDSLVDATSSSLTDLAEVYAQIEDEELDGRDYSANFVRQDDFAEFLIDSTEDYLADILGARPDGKDIEDIALLVWTELIKYGYLSQP